MYGTLRNDGAAISAAALPDPRDAYSKNDPNLSRTIHDGRLRMSKAQLAQEKHMPVDSQALKSAIYGGVDGVLTAFAVVSGGAGGSLDPRTVLILGLSSLIGNAVSMGVSDVVSTFSEREHVMEERRREEWEFDNFPEGEIKEMVDLYEERGLPREKAEIAVGIMAKYKEFFLDIMVIEELGLTMPDPKQNPYVAGLVNSTSFLISGLFPLLAYVFLLGKVSEDSLLRISSASTLAVLFGLGVFKSKFSVMSWWRSGFEFCVLGGCCAFVAYMIGSIVAVSVGHSLPV